MLPGSQGDSPQVNNPQVQVQGDDVLAFLDAETLFHRYLFHIRRGRVPLNHEPDPLRYRVSLSYMLDG